MVVYGMVRMVVTIKIFKIHKKKEKNMKIDLSKKTHTPKYSTRMISDKSVADRIEQFGTKSLLLHEIPYLTCDACANKFQQRGR